MLVMSCASLYYHTNTRHFRNSGILTCWRYIDGCHVIMQWYKEYKLCYIVRLSIIFLFTHKFTFSNVQGHYLPSNIWTALDDHFSAVFPSIYYPPFITFRFSRRISFSFSLCLSHSLYIYDLVQKTKKDKRSSTNLTSCHMNSRIVAFQGYIYGCHVMVCQYNEYHELQNSRFLGYINGCHVIMYQYREYKAYYMGMEGRVRWQ